MVFLGEFFEKVDLEINLQRTIMPFDAFATEWVIQTNLLSYRDLCLKIAHVFENIMENGAFAPKEIERLLFWSKCSIFHNSFKSIQNLT